MRFQWMLAMVFCSPALVLAKSATSEYLLCPGAWGKEPAATSTSAIPGRYSEASSIQWATNWLLSDMSSHTVEGSATKNGVSPGIGSGSFTPKYLADSEVQAKLKAAQLGKLASAPNDLSALPSTLSGSAIDLAVTTKYAKVASNDPRLTSTLKALQQHSDLGVRNSVRDLESALEKLRSPEQRHIAEAAIAELGGKSGTHLGKIPPNALAENIKAMSARTQIASMEGVVDPRILEAYLGDRPEKLSAKELLDRTNDPQFRALTGQINSIPRIDNSDLVKMVAPGHGLNAGGLSEVPRRGPVAWGTTDKGQDCLRPAVTKDYKLDPATNRINRVWDPAGFRDVGLLLVRKKEVAGKSGEPSVCSFVRVGNKFAVTAAHCVVDSKSGEPIRLIDFGSNDIEAIALIPQLDAKFKSPTACFTSPDTCGYLVAQIKTEALLPDSTTWKKGTAVPNPDIALLSLPFSSDAPSVRTSISSTSTADVLTLAGYGLTDAKYDARPLGTLLVGWQMKSPSLSKGELIWSVDLAAGAATACKGDSGGAVFNDDLSGLPSEEPLLAGIISWAAPPKKSPTSDIGVCTNSPFGRAVRVDAHFTWLCDKSNNAIRGCTVR